MDVIRVCTGALALVLGGSLAGCEQAGPEPPDVDVETAPGGADVEVQPELTPEADGEAETDATTENGAET